MRDQDVEGRLDRGLGADWWGGVLQAKVFHVDSQDAGDLRLRR